jgi:ABC-type multidrug transport system ATPase subunit
MQKLELHELSAGYGSEEVIHRISLELTEPSIYVVLGPNGAGKTTLFRTISGILKPFSGQAKFDGLDKCAPRRDDCLQHFEVLC